LSSSPPAAVEDTSGWFCRTGDEEVVVNGAGAGGGSRDCSAVLPSVLQLNWSAKLQSFRWLTATLKADYEQTMTSTYHLSIHNICRFCRMHCVNLLSVDDNASYYKLLSPWLLSGQ
jgi:hypothetical protein